MFESTIPKAENELIPPSFEQIVEAMKTNIGAAEVAIAVTLKKHFESWFPAKKLKLGTDKECAPYWVVKDTVVWDEDVSAETVEDLCLALAIEVANAVNSQVSRTGGIPVFVDGLGVKLHRPSNRHFALTLTLRFEVQHDVE